LVTLAGIDTAKAVLIPASDFYGFGGKAFIPSAID
jgi:hypothetical protein